MGYGDEIVAAGQAQYLHDTDASHRRVAIIDLRGHRRWHPIWDHNPILVHPDEYVSDEIISLVSAPNARPYIVYPFTEYTGWTFNQAFRCRDHVAKIYLTDEEKAIGLSLRERAGPYILIEPWSKHANLTWPLEHWQALIALRPDLTFVQHVHADSPLLDDVLHVHASFRQACGLAAASSLYIRGESGMCHAAAALGVPQVTIWGACMDWNVMGGYDYQVGLLNFGGRPACGSYRPCLHCADAMRGIPPKTVSAAIDAMRWAAA